MGMHLPYDWTSSFNHFLSAGAYRKGAVDKKRGNLNKYGGVANGTKRKLEENVEVWKKKRLSKKPKFGHCGSTVAFFSNFNDFVGWAVRSSNNSENFTWSGKISLADQQHFRRPKIFLTLSYMILFVPNVQHVIQSECFCNLVRRS